MTKFADSASRIMALSFKIVIIIVHNKDSLTLRRTIMIFWAYLKRLSCIKLKKPFTYWLSNIILIETRGMMQILKKLMKLTMC
jgi:hypothetical protein